MLAQRAVEDSPRWTRAVEDHSAPIPEKRTSKLGGSMYMVRCAQSKANHVCPDGSDEAVLFECACDVAITIAIAATAKMAKCAVYVSGKPMVYYRGRNWQFRLLCGSA
jgi:hypothetical protein